VQAVSREEASLAFSLQHENPSFDGDEVAISRPSTAGSREEAGAHEGPVVQCAGCHSSAHVIAIPICLTSFAMQIRNG
jgi:hypothetical protein